MTWHISTVLDRIEIYFGSLIDVNKSLDIIQIVCFYMQHLEESLLQRGFRWPLINKGEDAITEINQRFKMLGVGYQYIDGKIIRIGNEILHAEATEKTLQFLRMPAYNNVSVEFLTAHEHFRFGRNADCLNWCLKSFESIIKIVADQNGWIYEKGATAKTLIQLLFNNNFFPPFLQNAMSAIQNFLENSINTIRNKKGGHGSGGQINHVPESLAQYMLYITGSTLNLIIETQTERLHKKTI